MKSKIKVLARLVSSEVSLPALTDGLLTVSSHGHPSVYVAVSNLFFS